jgi:multiple sugar transport system ATP-binding protein
MNLHDVRVVDGHADLSGYRVPLPSAAVAALDRADEGRVTLGFRPDAVDIGSNGDGLAVTVEVVEELGSDAYLFASLPGHDDVREIGDLIARIDPRHVPQRGSTVAITIRPDEIHLFSPSTGERLN